MRLIDADMVLKDIKDLQESPWHNNGAKSDSLCLQNQYVGRKEAVEIVRDLCVVNAKEVQAIPLDKIKQAREEIENINPIYSTIGDRIPVLKNCDDIKAEVLAILDKLIESEG